MPWQSRSLTLHAYEPAAVGSDFAEDIPLGASAGLEAVKAAYGGYWSLRFNLKGRQSYIEEWIEDGLGRDIRVYGPALDLIWEGFVNSISANIGSLTINRGPYLDIANKIKVVYSTVDTSVTPPVVGVREDTAWAQDTTSQAKYGILEKVVSVGGADATSAEQIRDVALEDMKDPQSDETDNLTSSAEPSASIEVLGYFHLLKTYTLDLSTTGLQNASAKVQAILGADPNSVFSTDYNFIETNATQVGAYENDWRVAETSIRGLTALGDSSNNRWVFGFGPDKKAFYKAVPTTTLYQRQVSDPTQMVFDYTSDDVVYPWDVAAGKWMFYTDIMIGRTTPSDRRKDPRYLFIEEATYTVPWGLTLRGSRTGRLSQTLARLGLGGTHA